MQSESVASREVRDRRAVRAVVLSRPGDEVLMLRFKNPFGGQDLWLTPGGGIHRGENDVEALDREIWEETGLRLPTGLPLVWQRVHTYPFKPVDIRQAEDFYLARVARFTPTSDNNPVPAERNVFREFRWWSVGEMRASRELFVPRGFADLVDELILNGPPPTPTQLTG